MTHHIRRRRRTCNHLGTEIVLNGTAQINLGATQNSLVASTPQLRQRRVIRTQLVEAYIGNEIIPSGAARVGLTAAQNSSLAGWPRLRPLTALC